MLPLQRAAVPAADYLSLHTGNSIYRSLRSFHMAALFFFGCSLARSLAPPLFFQMKSLNDDNNLFCFNSDKLYQILSTLCLRTLFEIALAGSCFERFLCFCTVSFSHFHKNKMLLQRDQRLNFSLDVFFFLPPSPMHFAFLSPSLSAAPIFDVSDVLPND